MGNITSGHDIIAKVETKTKCFGLTLPIITNEAGNKLGKSAGNAVWLDDKMLPPFSFYQFFVNTSDQMVETYLKLFTFLPLNEIDDLMRKHKLSPEKFLAQKKLASELTLLVHGSILLNFYLTISIKNHFCIMINVQSKRFRTRIGHKMHERFILWR